MFELTGLQLPICMLSDLQLRSCELAGLQIPMYELPRLQLPEPDGDPCVGAQLAAGERDQLHCGEVQLVPGTFLQKINNTYAITVILLRQSALTYSTYSSKFTPPPVVLELAEYSLHSFRQCWGEVNQNVVFIECHQVRIVMLEGSDQPNYLQP
jgi:hypothetical protein